MTFGDGKNVVDRDVLVECFLRMLVRSGDINSVTYHNAVKELKKEENSYGYYEQKK